MYCNATFRQKTVENATDIREREICNIKINKYGRLGLFLKEKKIMSIGAVICSPEIKLLSDLFIEIT